MIQRDEDGARYASDTHDAPTCTRCGMLAFGRTGDDMEAAALHESRYGHAPVVSDTHENATESVARYTPDRTKRAPVERLRLLKAAWGAETFGDAAEYERLIELDSELFDVIENGPAQWRAR